MSFNIFKCGESTPEYLSTFTKAIFLWVPHCGILLLHCASLPQSCGAKFPLWDTSKTSPGLGLVVQACCSLLAALQFRKHSPGAGWGQIKRDIGGASSQCSNLDLLQSYRPVKEYGDGGGGRSVWEAPRGGAGSCLQCGSHEVSCFVISNTLYHVLFL